MFIISLTTIAQSVLNLGSVAYCYLQSIVSSGMSILTIQKKEVEVARKISIKDAAFVSESPRQLLFWLIDYSIGHRVSFKKALEQHFLMLSPNASDEVLSLTKSLYGADVFLRDVAEVVGVPLFLLKAIMASESILVAERIIDTYVKEDLSFGIEF
jgi:hypothetical protein